jgi:hypothetical protein
MESASSIQRFCQNCGTPITGRQDKKFCSNYCRSESNNRDKTKSYHAPVVRNITNVLLKNRTILESILGSEVSVKTTKTNLLDMGFNFKYSTHTFTSTKGGTYFYCFDYGYLYLKDEWYLLVTANK